MNPADVETPAQNLVKLIKQLIKEEQYEGVALLFATERNHGILGEVAMELYNDVCKQYLKEVIHQTKFELYSCVEELLKTLAAHAPAEELLLELLEIVEEEKSEYVFTSALRALQVILLRISEKKPRSLEWTCNSIYDRLEELPYPEYLKTGYDEEQERLLEQEDDIQSLLMHHITINLFYEPILIEATKDGRAPEQIFRDCSLNRRNVFCCFLVQLLDKPLSLLDLATDDRRTNTYTSQCTRKLTESITKCIVDPFYLLALVEQRVRWKRKTDPSKGVYELSCQNIFLNDEKLPLTGLAIYFYMVLVAGIDFETIPKIYAPIFVFESCLYLSSELIKQDEAPLHYRGIVLMDRVLDYLNDNPIPAISLELEVHKRFCQTLCEIVVHSGSALTRQEGVKVLRKYILQFDDAGKYLVVKNLLQTVKHNGICGFLTVLYKDIVADALLASSTTLPTPFSGQDFRAIFLQNICHLPNGIETDLLDNADCVISTLNTLRFFAINDSTNRTGFWNIVTEIQKQYLISLRKSLDLAVAHYRAELVRVEKGLDSKEDAEEWKKMQMLELDIKNSTSVDQDTTYFELDRDRKKLILNQNICTFDLMHSLLARTMECIENSENFAKSKVESEQIG